MVNTLLVYKGEEVIKRQQENKDGKTSVIIDGLKSNTDYTKGTYKLAWSNGAEEGPKADVPAFKTDKVGVTTVTSEPSSTKIIAGETQQITSEVAPTNADDKTLIYTSNNEPVATVDDSGLITAVKAGNATITVKSNDNATATSKVSVTVEKAVVNVSSVELTPATATLDIGATQQLSANVLPSEADNKKVTYSSGSDAIATVSATGLVTAVGEGTTDITVTTEDGAKTATSSITVNAAEVTEPPEEVTDPPAE